MINAVIVDDEIVAIKRLSQLLENFPEISIERSFSFPTELLSVIHEIKPDLCFLDIEMPEYNGIELGLKIRQILPDTHIIFVTAYDNYALKAFEVEATDYLLKPIKLEKLQIAVEKVLRKKNHKQQKGVAGVVHLFGKIELRENKELLPVKWRSGKVRELFAFLAFNSGKPIAKELIIKTIWPDKDLSKTGDLLNTCIYQLRKDLSTASLPFSLQAYNGYYFFDLKNWICDAAMLSGFADMFRQNPGIDFSGVEHLFPEPKLLFLQECYSQWVSELQHFFDAQLPELSTHCAQKYLIEKNLDLSCKFAEKALGYDSLYPNAWEVLLKTLEEKTLISSLKKRVQQMKKIYASELKSSPPENLRSYWDNY